MPYTKLKSCYSKNLSIPFSLNDPYNPYSYTQTFPIFENSMKNKEISQMSKMKDAYQTKNHNLQNKH